MSVVLATKGRVLSFSGSSLSAPRTTIFGNSLEEISNIIRCRFEDLVVGSIEGEFPTQYDNAPFEKPDDSVWARLTILVGQSRQVSFGSTRRYRTTGISTASVFTPIRQGDKQGLEIADVIFTAFNTVIDSGVTFRTPSIRKVGRQGESWQINVLCPFYADSIS